MKTIMIISFSNKGAILSKKVESCLDEYKIENYTYYKYAENNNLKSFDRAKEFVKDNFNLYDYWIFIGALGIAVREVAPNLKSKIVDPGVICMDELGKFVISLLSGHIGGANEMTRLLSNRLNAIEVITTATDINGKFALDEWATKNDMYISNFTYAKEFAGILLEKDIALLSDFEIDGKLPNGVKISNDEQNGIYVTYQTKKPFEKTLYLVPKVIVLGIGCKKNTSMEHLEEAINSFLTEHEINKKAIKAIASIDVKKEEQGIIELADEFNVPFITYTKEELNSIEGDFSYSEFVYKTVGVDCVCERSCVKATNTKVLYKKQAYNGITISASLEDYHLHF